MNSKFAKPQASQPRGPDGPISHSDLHGLSAAARFGPPRGLGPSTNGNPMNRMMAEPLQKLAGGNYDPRYQQNAADEFRQFGLPPGGRVFPTPEFTPDYAYRDPVFVMPPNRAAHNLDFDSMDLADRQFYRERTFEPPPAPKMRRF